MAAKRKVSQATLDRLRELRRKNGLGEFKSGGPKRKRRASGARRRSSTTRRGLPAGGGAFVDYSGQSPYGVRALSVAAPARPPSAGYINAPSPNPRSETLKRLL